MPIAYPEISLSRKKQGFSIPLKTWLKSSWNGLMHDVLARRRSKRRSPLQLENDKPMDVGA